MEKINLNFNGGDNILKSICWILSIISWLLFLITGWISLGEKYDFWTIPKTSIHWYIPSQMDKTLLMIVFIVTLVISTLGFCAYLVHSTCIKSTVFNGMMEGVSRFHFIPFACAGGLFLIGETITNSDNSKNYKNLLITGLIFSIIGFISLILVHFKTKMDPWYISLLIKKATFSCLIALFTYSICYTIYQIGFDEEIDDLDLAKIIDLIIFKKSSLISFINNCAIAFPIVIGVVNLCLAFALRDIMIAVMNLLMYIGSTIFFYDIDKSAKDYFKNDVPGIIDIIMIVLSAITIGLLLFMYRADTFKK